MISVFLQCVQTGAERDGIASCWLQHMICISHISTISALICISHISTTDMRRQISPPAYPLTSRMRPQWISRDISCGVSRYPEISVENLLISTDIYWYISHEQLYWVIWVDCCGHIAKATHAILLGMPFSEDKGQNWTLFQKRDKLQNLILR